MAKRALLIAGPARRDIVQILEWSSNTFGDAASRRYAALLRQAMIDIREDPERPSSRARPELYEGARTYPIALSRDRVAGVRVQTPRHFLLYRQRVDGAIEVARVLHDNRDLSRI